MNNLAAGANSHRRSPLRRRKSTMVWAAALLLQLASLLAEAAAATRDALPDCPAKCGKVSIPYPFGIGKGCFMEGFDITCTESSAPLLSSGNIMVVNISLTEGQLAVNRFKAYDCYNKDGSNRTHNEPFIKKAGPPYRFSDRNKFVAVGCDTLGLLQDDESGLQTGCFPFCDDTDGTCAGIGCCQTPIPKGLIGFTVALVSICNHTKCWDFDPCSYGFLADDGWLDFGVSSFSDLRNETYVPVTLDWAIGNQTCEEAIRSSTGFACKAEHSRCLNSTNGPGCRCNCLLGWV